MLDPAIEGTLNVVRSTHQAGIKRIVITSSAVASLDFALGGVWRDYTYTADDWYDPLITNVPRRTVITERA